MQTIDSVQFSWLVVSDSLRPHESQHAWPPHPSPTPGLYSNSCPSSRWCHPAISSSVVPFYSCPQSLPASGSFLMSQLFPWGGQSIGISASASVCLVKAMVFPVVMYGCESWTVKKAEHRKTDAFELWCWRRLLRVPRTARRSNQSVLKEISLGCSLEGLMLKLEPWTSPSLIFLLCQLARLCVWVCFGFFVLYVSIQ